MPPTATGLTIADVLRDGTVTSVFQPIVDLDAGSVVAHEALARGPQGPLANPDALFEAARGAGLLAELDAACRAAAFRCQRAAPARPADPVRQRRAGGAGHRPRREPAGHRRRRPG